jgi:hypothetical protein
MYMYSTNHRKTLNSDFHNSYDCKHTLTTRGGVNRYVSASCPQTAGSLSVIKQYFNCKTHVACRRTLKNAGKRRLLFAVTHFPTAVFRPESHFSIFFKNKILRRLYVFKKSSHVDELHNAMLRNVFSRDRYFFSKKKMDSGEVEISSHVSKTKKSICRNDFLRNRYFFSKKRPLTYVSGKSTYAPATYYDVRISYSNILTI